MKTFLILWVLPMSLFAGWYGLSFNDMNFGMLFFSRAMHDEVMSVYATTIGVAPEAMPGLLLRALIVDTALVMAIMAFRHRKALKARFFTPAEAEGHRAPIAG